MSKINDGGPAFPHEEWHFSEHATDPLMGQHEFAGMWRGMSIRDYFAGQAAAAMCGAITGNKDEPHYATVAIRAYVMADAMLAAREAGR